MNVRRARKFVGVLSLVFVAGCVALTGIGDLSVGDLVDDAGGSLPPGTVNFGDGSARLPDGNVVAVRDSGESTDSGDAAPHDAGVDTVDPPKDSGSTPVDSGHTPVDSGNPPPTGPSVKCNSLTCSGQKAACCYALTNPVAECMATPSSCSAGVGYTCDDDGDCAKGNVCCAQTNLAAAGSSSCVAPSACTGFLAARVCTDDTICQKLEAGTCSPFPYGPSTIKTCQPPS